MHATGSMIEIGMRYASHQRGHQGWVVRVLRRNGRCVRFLVEKGAGKVTGRMQWMEAEKFLHAYSPERMVGGPHD